MRCGTDGSTIILTARVPRLPIGSKMRTCAVIIDSPMTSPETAVGRIDSLVGSGLSFFSNMDRSDRSFMC